MAKKVTKKDLVAAYKELDKVVGGVDPEIEYDGMSLEEFEEELNNTAHDLIEPTDKFSKSTQDIFDYLTEKYGTGNDDEEEIEEEDEEEIEEEEEEEEEEEKPIPVPVKKGKKGNKPESEPEPEPEPEEEDEEDEEDEDEDEDEEESLEQVVKATTKREGLYELIKENNEFKKKRKELLAEKNVFTLKKAMLACLSVPEKPVKTEKVTKVEKKTEKPVKIEKVKKDKPVKKEKITRPKAIALAIQKNPKIKTIADWVKLADSIYVENGGISNIAKMKQDVVYIKQVFSVLGISNVPID
jgi:chemotaxis protein histidine kinase CheA